LFDIAAGKQQGVVQLEVWNWQCACFNEDGVMMSIVWQAEGSPEWNDEQAFELEHECVLWIAGQADEWQSICNLGYEHCVDELSYDWE